MEKAFERLLKFATLRPRSEKEIKDWFKRKKIDVSLQEKLFEKLTHFGLVNDSKFALWWIDQRLTFKPKGKKAIFQELKQKGVAKDIIENALFEIDIDEPKIAKELISKNRWRWERFDPKKRREKMTNFLLRRGFDWEVTKKVK